MIQLFHNDMSVCSQKVRFTLEEAGIEWESHHLKLRENEQLRPEYLAINPKGQVPAVVDDGKIILESTIINEYLVDSRNIDWLLPADAQGRATMRWWTRQFDDDVFRSIAIVSQAIAFRRQSHAAGAPTVDHDLESVPEEARREMKRVGAATGLGNPSLPIAVRRLNKLLEDMEAVLSDGEWLAGGRISLADIGLATHVQRLEHLALSMLLDCRPNLQSWFARIRERPAYIKAVLDWLNPNLIALWKNSGEAASPLISEMLVAQRSSIIG